MSERQCGTNGEINDLLPGFQQRSERRQSSRWHQFSLESRFRPHQNYANDMYYGHALVKQRRK